MERRQLGLGCFTSRDFLADRSFFNLSCLNTRSANPNASDGSAAKFRLYALKIRHKTAARNTGSLLTDTARLFGKTAACNGASNNWFFVANSTMSHDGVL